jgi:RNA polymerase sigma-70 factor (ECF subfamily)
MIKNVPAARLVDSAIAGDEEAFALLYENFYTPIFRFVLKKVSNAELAEDLTQTVFMKAWKSDQALATNHPSPLAYFYTVARNLVTDYYRKQKTVSLEGMDEAQDKLQTLPSDDPDPQMILESVEAKNFVKDLLGNVKTEYREVLDLKFLRGYSNAEVAKKLGKSEMNIRQIQVRALRKLKSHLH